MSPQGGGFPSRSKSPQPNSDLAPFGDDLHVHSDSVFRCVFVNPGGLPVDRKNEKSKIIEELVRPCGASSIGFAEVNVNWSKLDAVDRLNERVYGWWRKCSINIAYYASYEPKKKVSASAHQFGGVAQISVNDGASRLHSTGVDPTGLGRWAWTRYQGKTGHGLRVITAYRCNKANSGAETVFNQQKAYFSDKDDDRCPRQAFWEDLVKEIETWTTPIAGSDSGRDNIVLGVDMNDNVRDDAATALVRRIGLKEIITHRHGRTGPRTCNRGSAPIDGLFVSAGLLESKCGYRPFVFDHRMLWIDLDLEQVFGQEIDISPRFKPQRLQNDDRRTRDRYLEKLAQLLEEESNFSTRLDSLFNSVTEGIPLNKHQQAEFDQLLEIHQQAARQAEKCCRKLRMGKKLWTPAFTANRNRRLFWLKIIARFKGKKVNSKYLQRLAKKAGVATQLKDITEPQAIQSLKSANAMCAAYAKLHIQERDRFIDSWAAAEEVALTITKEAAIRKRNLHERQRRDGRIISHALGKSGQSGVSKVLVEGPDGIHECSTKAETEEAFLNESNVRFRQASDTPALTILFKDLGPLGTTSKSDDILNGNYVAPPETDYWTTEWLKEMAKPPNFTPMGIHRSEEDFANGWSKAKERTSASPFGLRFANFKAHTFHEGLLTVDYKIAQIPLLTGYSPKHWQQAMNAWILKKPNEFRVGKMRTILLYDAAFNQNNKWTGRAAMWHSEQIQKKAITPTRQALAPEQFGSRKGHQPIDQCLNKRLTFDLSRILHYPMALCANDAKSCYDRVVHSIASLCMQRIGCPKPVVISMFETLQHLRHHVRSQYGDSEIFYKANQSPTPIQGLGQGNGAGPTIWALISTPVLNLLRTHGYGIKITSCISGDFLHFVGYCFVDDTDLIEFPETPISASAVATSMQEAVDAWEAGIRAGGGAIVPEKSHWYLINYKWQNGNWRYDKITENMFDLSVKDSTGNRVNILRLDPSEAERTLGARIAPKGSCNKEKAYLRDCAVAWAEHIRTG